ncbi:hypothetical protein QZH41_013528 [Actinostola sp. cb2023]|nr:hypothetical protein QZH41_013528 [Actinostola sp. cb2023]
MAAKQEGFRVSTHVHFVCQRCNQPLRIDPNLSSIDSDALAELTDPLPPFPSKKEATEPKGDAAAFSENSTCEVQNQSTIMSTRLHVYIMHSVEGNGFTLIGDTQVTHSDSLSYKLKQPINIPDLIIFYIQVTTKLFDVMSGQSDVDHPLCEECTDTLLDHLDEQLRITEDELKDYKEFLHKLNEQHLAGDESLSNELTDLEKEEQQLIAKLEEVEEERKKVSEALEKEKQISKELDEAEKAYFIEYCEYQKEILEFEDEQQSVENQLRYAQAQLDKLRKTNVFNSTFHIWRFHISFDDRIPKFVPKFRSSPANFKHSHKGHFGTINNFRLGRLPSVPVEWSEINAAWGQTVLLLHSLARKMNLTFERYRLVPFGNHSYLESLSDKSKELPLYGSGGFRFFWDAKHSSADLNIENETLALIHEITVAYCSPFFIAISSASLLWFDHAMVAFLDCLQQFKEAVEKVDKRFCLPYRMEKGKIYDSSGNGGAFSINLACAGLVHCIYSTYTTSGRTNKVLICDKNICNFLLFRIQFNSEEQWTKALKFMLTNLKWGLAWVSSQFTDN